MGFILGVIIWLLRLVTIALLLYFVLGFVAPASSIAAKAKPYIEPIIEPFRGLLGKYAPSLDKLSIDLSPIAAMLAISILKFVLQLIRSIF